MKVLVLTYGTTGDVVPYVALGQGLKKRGHSVVICANSRFEEFITGHGLEYAYMNDEITQLIESATGRSTMEGLNSFFGFLVTALKPMRRSRTIQVNILHDTWSAAQRYEPDLILFSPKNIAGVHFAEKLKIPAVSAPLFPQFIPTGELPALGFPRLFRGAGYNRFSYRVVRKISGLLGGKTLKNWRKENGLPPAFCGIDVCRDAQGNSIPAVNGYSAYLVPSPPVCERGVRRWSARFLVTSRSGANSFTTWVQVRNRFIRKN